MFARTLVVGAVARGAVAAWAAFSRKSARVDGWVPGGGRAAKHLALTFRSSIRE